MALHADLDSHLRQVVGNNGFTVVGSVATLPSGSLDHRRLEELLEKSFQLKHDVVLTAGVLTVKPR
jgi:hypothetical protein